MERDVDDDCTLHDIKDGLDNQEFILHYQPKVSLLSGKVVGAECLARWWKNGKFISPAKFIGLAEESGFITVLTEHFFKLLLGDLPHILAVRPDIVIAFNISSHDLRHQRILRLVNHNIDKGAVNPANIQLELTEGTVADFSYETLGTMHALVKRGVALALDDFGTGFSSLEVLSTFPFSYLKLDQSLIKHITRSGKAKSIVSSNIRMAHRLGLHTIAEGVETEEVYDRLTYSGCQEAQGYWISRPIPLPDFVQFLRTKTIWPSNPIGLLYQAQLDHIQWRKDILETYYYLMTVRSRGYVSDEHLETFRTDHTGCNLGKWYYGVGRMYESYEQYRLIEPPHAELHVTGHRLIDAAIAGDHEACHELIMHLSALSTRIIECLHSLEAAVHRTPRSLEEPLVQAGGE